MRYLIILLFPVFSYSQVIVTNRGSSTSGGPTSTYGIGTVSWTGGKIQLLQVVNRAVNPAIPTVTTAGMTWNLLITDTSVDHNRMSIFVAYPLSTVSAGTSITYGGQTQQVAGWSIADISGRNIRTIQAFSDKGISANPSITMPSLTTSGSNMVLYMVLGNLNVGATTQSGTPETGWTENLDVGNSAGVPFNMYRMYMGTTTDNTPTVTMASNTWVAIGVEIISKSIINIQ